MPDRDNGLISVKEAIKNNPKGITITGLATVLGMSRNTVSKYLDMLHISGQVEMRAYGPAKVYSISHRVPINAMLDLASDLIVVLDERLEVLQANDNAVRFLGLKKEGLIGSRLEKTVTPLFSEPKVLDHAREALNGISSSFEIEWPHENQIFFFKARAIPTTMGNGKTGVTLILEDITEQKKAREDLSYSEEKYRSLFESSEYAILINDDDGHIECNRAMKRLLRTDDSNMIMAQLNRTAPPKQPDGRDSIAVMEENIRKVKNGTTVRFDWTLIDFAGNLKSTEVTFTPITIKGKSMRQAVVRDLSKQIEEQTKLLLMSTAVDAAVDSIIILDMKGCVMELNDSALRMLGLRDKREVIGEHWSKKIAASDEMVLLKDRYKQFLDAGSVTGLITRVRKHDGTSFPIEVSAAIIKDPSGNPRAIITVSRDISEKLRMAETLRKRDRIMNAISTTIYTLFDSEDPRYCMERMLQLIGEASDVSRSYISSVKRSDDGTISVSMVSGWTREGIHPPIEVMLREGIDTKGFDRWIGTLSSDRIIQGPVADFPESERKKLEALSIKSILVAPIIHRDEWIGIMGLDDCAEVKEWSQQEINVLRIGAKIASHILTRASSVPSHPLMAGHPVKGGDRAT